MARAQQGMLGAALALAAAWQLLHLPGAHATHPLQSPFAGIFEGYPPNLVRPARDLDAADYTRRTLRFPCSGESCEAWLYLPKATGSCTSRGLPPVVVAAHGLGGQKNFSLHAYGAAFSTAGLAVFMFDYRNYGGASHTAHISMMLQLHMGQKQASGMRAALVAARKALQVLVNKDQHRTRQPAVGCGPLYVAGHWPSDCRVCCVKRTHHTRMPPLCLAANMWHPLCVSHTTRRVHWRAPVVGVTQASPGGLAVCCGLRASKPHQHSRCFPPGPVGHQLLRGPCAGDSCQAGASREGRGISGGVGRGRAGGEQEEGGGRSWDWRAGWEGQERQELGLGAGRRGSGISGGRGGPGIKGHLQRGTQGICKVSCQIAVT
jgi:hypothetical protein